MLPAAQIPVGISVQDCLSWSQDGELAIASGEQVYVLIPNRSDSEPWKHINFRVDNFTIDDWPWPTQASFTDMSIGEEQARVTVNALAWSPPGLAKHRRSVLAVLTSNLLLSLWAPAGDVTDAQSWERVLIINWTFTPPSISTFHNGRRPLQRIRSMAWVPTYSENTDDLRSSLTRKWGTHFLAITDDDNGIYFLSVSSPVASTSVPWDAETLLYKEIQPNFRADDRPSLLNLALNARHFINRIEFGVWTSTGDIPVIYHLCGFAHHALLTITVGPPLQVKLTNGASDAQRVETPSDQSPRVTSLGCQTNGEKERYNAQNALDNQVHIRTWGKACLNSLRATCISLHPSNSLEFSDPSDGSAVVLFENGNDTNPDEDKFPWQILSKVDEVKTYQTILDSILDGPLLCSINLIDVDFKIIYAAVCAAVLADDVRRQQRLQAAEDLLHLVQSKTKTNLQLELEMIASSRNKSQASNQDFVALVKKTTEMRGQQNSDSNSPDIKFLDTCPYCPNDHPRTITFENIKEAYCPQSHPFTRCALTLLPILEPGSSKRCMDCGRELLNEQLQPEIVPKIMASASGTKPSLAAILFERFDTCVYCGGKFQD